MPVHVQALVHPRLAFDLDKSARLQQQLALLESGHTKLQRQMLLIKHFMDNSHEQMIEKQRLWLQMLHDAVSYKVSKFDEARQLPLRAKIVELELNKGKTYGKKPIRFLKPYRFDQ